jgi:hypothetical protein
VSEGPKSATDRVTIVAAAIRHEGLIFTLPRPCRHHHLLQALNALGLPIACRRHQGFLTSEGTFVDRVEGARLAIASGQARSDRMHNPQRLFSEDVW